MLHRRLIILGFALSTLFFQTHAFATTNTTELAQFDADDTYDPFSDYSEFDAAQEEEEDINFFRNGRFVTIGILAGYRGWTDTLGQLAQGGLNYGIFLSYFFDLRFAMQFTFLTGDHPYGFTGGDGLKHTGNMGIQSFQLDFKYYINTQNVTKGLAKFNPYVLLGFAQLYRTTSVSDTTAYGKDSANGFDIGGGIEIPMMKNKMFWGAQAMYQLVNFANEHSEIITAGNVNSHIRPQGDSYTLLGILGVNF